VIVCSLDTNFFSLGGNYVGKCAVGEGTLFRTKQLLFTRHTNANVLYCVTNLRRPFPSGTF